VVIPPIVVGHRGAPTAFPANTLAGFAHAFALGCTMVECDIRRSADGTLVLAHDETVTDRAGNAHRIAQTTAAELAALDLGAGDGVPTLDALVRWAADSGCALMADMKAWGDGVEEATVTSLSALPPALKLVPGAPPTSRARFRTLDPALPLSLSMGEALVDAAFDALLPTIDTEAVTWHHTMLNPARIRALQARGLRVFAWTVDDEPTMAALLAAGVDGIISNRPDLLRTRTASRRLAPHEGEAQR
jgi:glycerophosphoryl diester phosphodiesterase